MSGGITVVAAGGFHSMVLKEGDSLWVTGSNQHGQFGDGSTMFEKSFVELAGNWHGEMMHTWIDIDDSETA